MPLLDKIVRNAQHVWDEQGVEHLIFACERHGTIRNPLRVKNSRCEECWTITFLAQQCLLDDLKDGSESLHKFHEAGHKIAETAKRGEWTYRSQKPRVTREEVDERGTIILTDLN